MTEKTKNIVSVSIQMNATTVPVEVEDAPPLEIVEESTENIEDTANTQHTAFGYCIYCGSTNDLRREHVIPFGLDGNLVLPSATCGECANKTGEVERLVLRLYMQDVRIFRGMRSRKGHANASSTLPLKITRNGVQETVELPRSEYPFLLSLPIFAPPRNWTGEAGAGISLRGTHTISFGISPKAVLDRLGGSSVSIDAPKLQPVAFARMLAKIGFAFAASEGKLNQLDPQDTVVPSILGHVDDIGRWVGTLEGPTRVYPKLVHRLQLYDEKPTGFLVAEIQLFSDSQTPTYGVLLGRLK